MPHPLHSRFHRNNVLIFLLSFFFLSATFLRFWKLDQIPLSFYHDEMDYVFTGEAVARYGTDITGKWSPWQLQPLKTLNITAELTAGIHGVIQHVFGIGVQNGRLPSSLFGLGTIALVGMLVHALLRSKVFTFSTMMTLALSPWHIYISRTGYEAPIGLFFQCLFLFCLVKLTEVREKKLNRTAVLLTMLGLLLSVFFGYFTYHGLKFSFALMTIAATVWILFSRIPKWWKFTVIFGMFLLVSSLLLRTLLQNRAGMLGNRQSELIISSAFLTKIVDEQRRIAIDTPIDIFTSNKFTAVSKAFIERYLSVFDFYRFFVSGYESGFQFSLIVHGFFYLTGIPLLIIGVTHLNRKNRSALQFLLLFLLISPLVSAIQIGMQSIFRAALTYVILNIFIGCGIASLVEWTQGSKKNFFLLPLFSLFITAEVLFFGYTYFSEYPLRSTDNQYFFEKVLAGYLKHTTNPVLVVTKPDAFSRARAIVAYLHLMPKLSDEERQQFYAPLPSTYQIGTITVTQNCPDVSSSAGIVQLIDPGKFQECGYQSFYATASAVVQKEKKLYLNSLGSPLDGGTYFYILNDSVCANESLRNYAYANTFHQLDLLNLTLSEYCSTWVKTDSIEIR